MSPVLLPAISVVCGAALGLHVHLSPVVWLAAITVCLLLAACSLFPISFQWHANEGAPTQVCTAAPTDPCNPTPSLPGTAAPSAFPHVRARGAILLFATTAGFAVGGAALSDRASDRALHTPLRQVLDREFGGFAIETLTAAGEHAPVLTRLIIDEDAFRDDQVVSVRGRVVSIQLRRQWIPAVGGVSISVGGSVSDARLDTWLRGRTIEVPLTYRRPARYLDEGVSDSERDLALAGTTLFGTAKSGLLVSVIARGGAFAEWSARVRQHIRRAVRTTVGRHSTLSAAIVNAILIGDRTGLPDEIRLRLQAAGTYHVIAISGGNIAILASLTAAMLILTGFSSRPIAAVALTVLVVYAGIVTAGPSVWRATLMAAIYLFARMLDHRTAPWQAIGVTSIVLVAADPLSVRDAGFLLTFGATGVLVGVAGQMARLRAMSAPVRVIAAAVATSMAVEIALLPISALLFSRITVAGIVLNLVAIPAMTVTQVAGMIVASPLPSDTLHHAGGWAAHLGADVLVSSAALVEKAPWLTARVPPPSWLVVLVYYYGGLLACCGRLRYVRVAGLAAWAAATVFIVTGFSTALMPHARAGALQLTVFDVGQGEAMLLESPAGPRVMVDTGGMPFGGGGFDIGARVLEPALWARGVRSVSALLLTHADPDHSGGAAALLTDFRIGELWEGIPVPRNLALRNLHALARDARITPRALRTGQEQQLGDMTIRVLHPAEPDWERPKVRNDDSVVLEVRYRDVAILLTGDISAEIEREILPRLSPARVRILKVAHHGSRTSSSQALLEAWRPHIAIISCGRANRFGHPAPEVIARLESIGARVYRTDLDGEITLSTDGRDVEVGTFVGRRQ